MVSPQYDKASGMTVSTEKKGADATITVTSGDRIVRPPTRCMSPANHSAATGTTRSDSPPQASAAEP